MEERGDIATWLEGVIPFDNEYDETTFELAFNNYKVSSRVLK